jgi:hypothetical protein
LKNQPGQPIISAKKKKRFGSGMAMNLPTSQFGNNNIVSLMSGSNMVNYIR